MDHLESQSWVQAKSQHALKKRLKNHGERQLNDNARGKSILPRRLNFVKPQKECNRQPLTYSNTPTPRQHSDFKYAEKQLFPESSIPGLMRWRSAKSVGSGLRNLGNSCFMNATLQCMAYTVPFQNYIQGHKHQRKCSTSGFCIFCELCRLMPDMLRSPNTSVPTKVFQNLRLLSHKLRPGRQEDAQEFLRFMMEGLQNNTLKTYPKSPLLKDMRVQETSIIHKIWGGYLRSQIKCTHCKYESNTYDSILDISLEIKGSSVRSAFKHFTDPEVLDGDNMYNCSKCKQKRPAIKQFTLFEPPNILSVHLKRFESAGYGSGYGGSMFSGGKINSHVKFEEHLDLSDYMSYQTCPKVSYSLFGVLVHYGYSAHGGHYVSYIKSPDGQWYLMDDSRVQSVSTKTVLKEKAYLLFYQRNEDKVLYSSPGCSPTSSPVLSRKNSTGISSKSTKSKFGERVKRGTFDGLKDLAKTLPNTDRDRDREISIPKSRSKPRTERIIKSKVSSHRTPVDYINLEDDDEMKCQSLEPKLEMKPRIKMEIEMKEDIDELLTSSPPKRRKLDNGHGVIDTHSRPVKVDTESRKQQLKLLKQRMSRRKSPRKSNAPFVRSMSVSSSSSSGCSSPYGSMSSVVIMRRRSGPNLVGRRSHTLQMAARGSLCGSPRAWHRKRTKRPTQLPTTTTVHNLPKWKDRSISPTMSSDTSESSSGSLLSEEQKSQSSTDDSMCSLSPRDTRFNREKTLSPTMPVLPACDGSSPRTRSKSGIAPPVYHLKDMSKHNLSLNISGNTQSGQSTRRSSKKQHSARITDPKLVLKHLRNEHEGTASSAIGCDVGSWNDQAMETGKELRQAIIRKASEPIVEPKDEWDMALDTGLAYPKSQYKKADPWIGFDRRKKSSFQSAQKRHTQKEERDRRRENKSAKQRLQAHEYREKTRSKYAVNV